jgi:hypothetical protein
MHGWLGPTCTYYSTWAHTMFLLHKRKEGHSGKINESSSLRYHGVLFACSFSYCTAD